MAIKMVRQPSQTPNINNIDDIIPFRYAYGNQSGYVIGKGSEVSNTINGNQFIINSGRLVIQGVESDIDANGVTLTIDSISETRYYSIYYKINLATNLASIESTFDTAGYPAISTGDDLTVNSSGTAYLELYRFTAYNGIITAVEKVVNAIEYSGTALVGYDISKGTIEERLNALGFKEGSVIFDAAHSIGTVTKNIIKRQGNYVIGNIVLPYEGAKNILDSEFSALLGTMAIVVGKISNSELYPNETLDLYSVPILTSEGVGTFNTVSALLRIDNNGNIFLIGEGASAGLSLNFGYEAKPIGE